MMRNMFSMVLAFFVALGFMPYVALAATNSSYAGSLPSSDEDLGRGWLRMNPSTFTASNASVLEQYDRAAKLDPRLTAEKRVRLGSMLATGQGTVVLVPDGIGLDYLTGRFEGSPFVYRGMVKRLGRSDRAVLYDLGDGVYIYWFTGDRGRSCNNIGIVIKRPPVPVGVAPPPPAKHKVVCQTVYAQKRSEPMPGMFISSLYLPDCCCDVLYTPSLYLPGGASDTMTISYQVCS